MSWGMVAGAVVSTVGGALLKDKGGGERSALASQQSGADYGQANIDRSLAMGERTDAAADWTSSKAGAELGQTYYNALADLGEKQASLWETKGLDTLDWLSGQKIDATDRTAEETGLAADSVKNQYALGRENTKRALEFARNPGDPGYADILGESYGREAADVAGAITTARRAERERLAGVEQQNWNRQKAIYDVYGAMPQQAAANLANAGMGTDRTSALYQNSATASERTADLADERANKLTQGAYQIKDKALASENEANAQLGYTAGNLATRAINKWNAPIDPKTGQPVASGNGYMNNGDYMNPGYDFEAGGYGSAFAEGGAIEGPGTGTSDSISAIKRPGSYILSHDTVRAIGTKKLTDMMDKAGVRPGFGGDDDKAGVAVKISNGEWHMPPEVTQYYGEEFFNKLQQKHHRPVFSADGAANGGAIRRRALPSSVEDAIFRGMPTRAISRRS